MAFDQHVRGRLIVPVEIRTTLYYDVGDVKNAHGMGMAELKLEAEDMVSEYLSNKLSPSRRVEPGDMTSKHLVLKARQPFLRGFRRR